MFICPICKWQLEHDVDEEMPNFTKADWLIHDNEGFVIEDDELIKVWP